MTNPQKPPPAQMLELITGYWISKMVFVVARLGIADELRDGPRSAEAIAEAVGVHPRRLHRLLRAMASVGVFAEGAGGEFSTRGSEGIETRDALATSGCSKPPEGSDGSGATSDTARTGAGG